MPWLHAIVIASSALLMGAALLAIRLARSHRPAAAWVLAAVVLTAMAVHPFWQLANPSVDNPLNPIEELFSLFASLFLFVGLLVIQNLLDERARAQRHYRAVLEAATDGFMVIEENGVVADVNDAYLTLTGRRNQTLVGRSLAELEAVEGTSEAHVLRWHAAVAGGLSRFQSVHRHASGTLIPVEISVTRRTGESGKTFAFVHDITERLRKERAIRDAEERLRASIEHTPYVAVQWYDPEGRVLFWNKASESVFGYTASEALGKTLDQLIFSPEAAQAYLQVLETLSKGGAPFGPAEFDFRRKDGTPGVCISTVFSTPPRDGVPCFVCMDVDITERKRYERSMKQNNLLLEAIGRAQGQFIADTSPTITFEQMLRSFLELSQSEAGFIAEFTSEPSVAEEDGRPGLQLVAQLVSEAGGQEPSKPTRIARVLPLCESMASTGQPLLVDAPALADLPGSSGSAPIQDFIGLPVRHEGRLLGVVGLANRPGGYHGFLAEFLDPLLQTCGTLINAVRSHQASRQAAEILRHSEERYRTVIELVPNGVFVIAEGLVQFCNSSAMHMLGASSLDQVVGRPLERFVHPDCLPTTRERMMVALKGGWLPPAEMTYVRLNGTPFPVEIKSSPITFNNKRGLLKIISDLTERRHAEQEQRRLEAQLRQSQKMEAIGTLAGGIAHDFNNLIGAIMGNAELLQADVADGSDHAAESVQEILRASARARDLVQSILTFSKPRTCERELLQLQPVLTEVIQLLSRTLPGAIEIAADIEPAGAAVHADPTQMHQVLMNLCTNAAHAMRGRGGVLSIALHTVDVGVEQVRLHPQLREGRFVCVTIRDTGHGMDPATLERIFEPFFTTKPPGEGTGLGLSVVHGIVRTHNGAVVVESRQGEGTAFSLYFPAIDAELVRVMPALQSLPRGAGEHILLVDDETSLIVPTQRSLEGLGYRVTACQSPVEALKAFQAAPDTYQLLISDLTMPKMSGLELSDEILRLRPGLPVVLISGYSGVMDSQSLARAGVKFWLEKPFLTADLADIAHRSLHPQNGV